MEEVHVEMEEKEVRKEKQGEFLRQKLEKGVLKEEDIEENMKEGVKENVKEGMDAER